VERVGGESGEVRMVVNGEGECECEKWLEGVRACERGVKRDIREKGA
jgi:hypothetical protein